MKKQSNGLVILFVLAFLGLLALAANAFFSRYPALTSENLDSFIRGFGPQAVLVFVLAYLLSSPIPFLAPILAATGGLLFGPVLGTLLSIFASTATSLVPFLIARRLGREWVEAKLQGTKFAGYYQKANQGNGFTFILLLRLVPLMPWELQNYVAGVTKVKVWTYLAATVVGCAPLSIALVILGATAKQPGSWQFWAALALTGAVLLTPIGIVALRRRRAKTAA
jgi:uncharacterized membrane protein YdjX (TVP38/TMEM64 family)